MNARDNIKVDLSIDSNVSNNDRTFWRESQKSVHHEES